MGELVYHCEVMADSKPAALRTAGPFLVAEVSTRVRPNAKLIAPAPRHPAAQ
jgi:hypothetical protein